MHACVIALNIKVTVDAHIAVWEIVWPSDLRHSLSDLLIASKSGFKSWTVQKLKPTLRLCQNKRPTDYITTTSPSSLTICNGIKQTYMLPICLMLTIKLSTNTNNDHHGKISSSFVANAIRVLTRKDQDSIYVFLQVAGKV